MTDKPERKKSFGLVTKEKAKKLYMEAKHSYAEISNLTGVPVETLAKWAKLGKWRQTKLSLARQQFEDAEIQYRKFQADNKLPSAQRQLDAASLIEHKVKETVESIDPDADKADVKLMRAAKTLNDAAAVTARAVGMADRKEDGSILEESQGKQQNKVPVIMLNIHAKNPEETPAIDVEYDEIETGDNDDSAETDDGSSG